MTDKIILNNQKAWEHLVYKWRIQTQGSPEEFAQKIKSRLSLFFGIMQNILIVLNKRKLLVSAVPMLSEQLHWPCLML